MGNSFIEVVQAAQQGDRDSFATLYSKTFRHTFFLTAKLIGNPKAAMGLVETTYYEVFSDIKTLRDPSVFPSWLTKTASSNCREYLAYNSSALFRNDDALTADVSGEEAAEPFIPSDWVDKLGSRSAVISVIDRLSEPQRTATYLRYYYEMNPAQIASYFSCSQNTVLFRLNEARLNIAEELDSGEGEGDPRVLTALLRKAVADSAIDRDAFEATFERIMAKLSPNSEQNYEEIEPSRQPAQQQTSSAQNTAARQPVSTAKVKYNPQPSSVGKGGVLASRTNIILAVVLLLLVAIAIPATVFGVKSIKNRNNGGTTPVGGSSTADVTYNFSTAGFETVTDVQYIGEGFAVFTDSTSGLKGLMNLKGDILVKAEFKDISMCSYGWQTTHIYAYQTNEMSGYEIDKQTYELKQILYHTHNTEPTPFWNSSRKSLVSSGEAGEVAYSAADLGLSTGLYAVADSASETASWGYVNEKGELMIDTEYQKALGFADSLGAVEKDGKWGYIDMNGKRVIPFDYTAVGTDGAYPFNQGYAPVKTENVMGIINKSNKTVAPFEFENIMPGSDGIFIAKKNGTWGTIVIAQLESSATEPHFTGEPSSLQVKYIVATENDPLNMRGTADQDADSIGKIPKGTILTVEKTSENWGYVTYNGVSGWVNMNYLSTNITGAQTTAADTAAAETTVAAQ